MTTRVQRIRTAIAAISAGLCLVISGSLLAAVIVASLVLVLPALLSTPVNRDIEILQAFDRWVRLLVGSVSTGKSLPDAVRATQHQVAPLLRRPVSQLIARFDARWPLDHALRALADDFASPDADAVVAAMVVAARRGGTGITSSLRALGDHTRHRLKSLREVETERAKPRMVVRQVTVITLAVLAGVAVLNPEYMAPYRSPVGQLVGALLFAGYLCALLMLRRVARPRPRERILQGGLLAAPVSEVDDA
ncbi:type II secretion system F family protein [Propionibacterium sp.]|uniref:type II secretion system F family protein n=1 Tax=Propionibacterium sp. TaxID=1977903 RepID=UPI0039E88D6F